MESSIRYRVVVSYVYLHLRAYGFPIHELEYKTKIYTRKSRSEREVNRHLR